MPVTMRLEMFWSKKYELILFLLFVTCALRGNGYFFADAQRETPLKTPYAATMDLSGQNRFFERIDRKKFRPDIKRFNAGCLTAEVRLTDASSPVKCRFYLKNKEGIWYQSVREFKIDSGAWQKLSVRIDRPGRDWCGVEHGGVYSADDLLCASEIGLSFYRTEPGKVKTEFRKFRFEGKREVRPLTVNGLKYPAAGAVNRVVEARFDLSREYFNAFDPDEISVDFELKDPAGKITRHPAFRGRDQQAAYYHAQESVTPLGKGYWALRFLPRIPGGYQFRLRIAERGKELLCGDWNCFTAEKSNVPGYVQVSEKNPHFFELSTGEFFFPVGINIHTNTDRAGSHLSGKPIYPDQGLRDTFNYFEECRKSGISLVEIWMAGWTLALEHTAAYAGYYGIGRYNMANAWKLDRILEKARECGIRVNLVIDNHGRLSHVDNEWNRNPGNKKTPFAAADGAYLENAQDYFRKEEAFRQNWKRSRYIAARWGADPTVFSFELWSELDLVIDFGNLRKDGSLEKWIIRTREDFFRMTPRPVLMTVHCCGTFHNIRASEKLFAKTGVTHYAGDAYRDVRQPMPDHFCDYRHHMKRPIPVMVTEYGDQGIRGGRVAKLRAELHFGLWSGMFARLAAPPMLWWHELVFANKLTSHHKGVAEYLKGVDFRGKKLDYYSPAVNNKECRAMAVAVDAGIYGWVFRHKFSGVYPDKQPVPLNGAALTLVNVPAGKWQLRWFDTLKGEISSEVIVQEKAGNLVLNVPAMSIDRAFRLEVLK